MKNYLFILVLLITVMFSSCEAVAGIFKAGMGFGIFLVVLVIGVILWLVLRNKKD